MRRSGFKRKPWKPRIKAKRLPRAKNAAHLKKTLDNVFSRYIRAKYPKKCYTCGKVGVILQNGHFIPRHYLATRWDERNCRPQCVGCNLFGGGKPLDFEENLKRELGDVEVESMKLERHQILKLDRNWYEKEIERLEKELGALSE